MDDKPAKDLLTSEHNDAIFSFFEIFIERERKTCRPLRGRSSNSDEYAAKFFEALIGHFEADDSETNMTIVDAAKALTMRSKVDIYISCSRKQHENCTAGRPMSLEH